VCLKKFGYWYQKTNNTEDTNKLTLFVSLFFCFLVPFTEHFRHTTYMELLVKPEILTSYGPTFGNAESRHFLFAAQCFKH
jgi:hypothetical protein